MVRDKSATSTWLSKHFLAPNGFFDQFEDFSNNLEKQDKFPPHNIERRKDDGSIAIKIALAGYAEKDLSVELNGNVLIVRTSDEYNNSKGTIDYSGYSDDSVEYIHKGISNKKFNKEFRISEGIKYKESVYKDGILSITFEDVHEDAQRIKIM